MSGAQDATTALRTKATAFLPAVAVAVRSTIEAKAAVQEADDLVPVMHSVVGLILTCEALAEAASDAAKTARIALAASMATTGATTLRSDWHTISLRDGSRTVIVTDPALIPASLMRHRDPEPDKAAIAKLLRDGSPVAGAALSNGGDPTIAIRSHT